MGGKSDDKSTLDIMMMVSKTSPNLLAFSQSSKKEKKAESVEDVGVLKAIKAVCDMGEMIITTVDGKVTCTQAGGKDDFLYMVDNNGTKVKASGLTALQKTDIEMTNENKFKKCNKTDDKLCPGADIVDKEWKLTSGSNEVGEASESPYKEKSCMVCLQGGAIYFVSSGQVLGDFEGILGNGGDWIPEIMNINGNSVAEKELLDLINNINNNIEEEIAYTQSQKEALYWNQEKINKTWGACKNFYNETGVKVDPRLLLAIIFKEGSGSFNTSRENLAADKQNGVNTNFDFDISNAVDLLGGKIIAYAYYKDDFSKCREEAYNEKLNGISDYDDILHYLNWETPRLKLNSQGFESGVYAGNNTWHRGVRQIYSDLAYEKVTADYTEYALSLGENKIFEVAQDYGIDIGPVDFVAEQDGADSKANPNGEYVIKGILK